MLDTFMNLRINPVRNVNSQIVQFVTKTNAHNALLIITLIQKILKLAVSQFVILLVSHVPRQLTPHLVSHVLKESISPLELAYLANSLVLNVLVQLKNVLLVYKITSGMI